MILLPYSRPWTQQPDAQTATRSDWVRLYTPTASGQHARISGPAIAPSAAGLGYKIASAGAFDQNEIVPGISSGITVVLIAQKVAQIATKSDFLFGEHETSLGQYNWGFYESVSNGSMNWYVHNGSSAGACESLQWTTTAGPQIWVGTFGDGDPNVRLYLNGELVSSTAHTGSVRRLATAYLRTCRWQNGTPNFVMLAAAVAARRFPAEEVREKFASLGSAWHAMFEPQRIWVPVSAGGGTNASVTTSLSAAIQQANALTAGLSAAVQTTPTASASLQAAVQASHSAQAQLDVAVQQARSAAAALDVAVQAAATPITTSLAAAVQLARSATAALDLAVQAQGSQTTSLSAQVQAAQQLSTSLSAQVQAGSSVSVAIAAAVLQQAVAAAGVDLAVQAPGAQTTVLGAALQVARNAAAALDLALSQARTVAASVSLQIQDGSSALASIDVAVQQARNAVTGVQLAIRQSSMASASLDAVLMLQRAVSAILNTAVVAPRSISTIINLYILTNASGIGVSELVTGATVLDRNLVARLVDALVIGQPFNRLS